MPGLSTYRFSDDGVIPNNPTLPVLVYRGVAAVIGDARACQDLFGRHGWGSMWRDGIYPFHHYHSTAHEVLGLVTGRARVMLGGPRGILFALTAGDIIILPAGTGHCNLGASDDLLVVGAYPPGQSWDLRRGEPDERPAVLHHIRAVPLPATDPVGGAVGPLIALWRGGQSVQEACP
jgi:uncharacterized protein YjlB